MQFKLWREIRGEVVTDKNNLNQGGKSVSMQGKEITIVDSKRS